MSLGTKPYFKGLHDLGNGGYAWLQPDGGWGLARQRYDAGMSMLDAAYDIALTDYDSWGDAERIVVNVATLYKEFAGDRSDNDVMQMFAHMARIYNDRRR